MPEEHAKLSASGSKKWINCPASIAMESKFPDESSEYAKEGTTAHSLGEAKLKLALNHITRVQYHKMIRSLDITEDMEEYTDSYRDFVLERYNAIKSQCKDAQIHLERRLDFSEWVPDGFGTGDTVIIGGGIIEIIDLKYGQGVKVSADKNSQLRIYGLGALSEYDYLYDIHKVNLTIFQPRLDNIDTETLTRDELIKWGEDLKPKAVLANSGDGDCIAGRHCDDGFCKARAVCRAYAEEKNRLAAMVFKPPLELTEDEIAEVIDQAENLAKWSKLVKDYALEQALNNGVKYPGFKVVEGRSNRKYAEDDSKIADVLIKAGYDEKNIYKKEILNIMMRTSAEALKIWMMKAFGLKMGVIAVLHTYGETKQYHVHTHMILSWGGIDGNGRIVVPERSKVNDAFIRSIFKHTFDKALIELFDNGKLKHDFRNRMEFMSFIKHVVNKKQWIVHLEPPLEMPEQVIQYIGRYSKRACLS